MLTAKLKKSLLLIYAGLTLIFSNPPRPSLSDESRAGTII
jgi:hypothetical protein